MIDPEDANYKCTLTEYSLKKSMKELNEDPKQRLGAVQALRKWIREQSHYTCRTDTKFLLAVLRRSKFSQLVARKLIDNFMINQTTHPELMANLDLHDPKILIWIEKGVIFPLPKTDKEGRRICILRPGEIDYNDPRMTPWNQIRTVLALAEMFRELDENQNVNGVIWVIDCTAMGLKFINQVTLSEWKTISNIYQDVQPERLKALMFYNAGTMFDIIMGFAKALLKKKNQERMQTFAIMEAMYKKIPMELWPDEYLPDDYKGPSAGCIPNISADFKKQMMNPEVRARVLANSSKRYKIDETKRPIGNTPEASFRKLNID